MAKTGTLLAALAAALALSNCGSVGGELIFNTKYQSGYTPSNFRSMAAAGAPIEVFGSPPGGGSPAEIVAAIRIPGRFGSAPPVLTESPGQGQRLVFAFSVNGAVHGPALCAGDVAAGAFDDRLEVFGAYCRGERVLTHSQLSVSGPVGPSDPRFTRVMARLIDILGPRTDPNHRNRSCQPFCV